MYTSHRIFKSSCEIGFQVPRHNLIHGSFRRRRGRPWDCRNYLNRVLKPAAIRARVGVYTRRTRKGHEIESTDVNFQVLRRTYVTLFGAKAKDPRDTQAQLRHADPSVTLRHYQKSIPASVRVAAHAFETELLAHNQTIRSGSEQVNNGQGDINL